MLRHLLLAFLLCQLCAQGVISQENPVIIPTTTAPPTPPTTTEKPETTTKPTPPTTKPTPPTTKPTTTEKPTTPAPPAPTPKPTPPPAFPANVGNWNVTQKNVTCILLTGALQLDIALADNTTHVKVDVPTKAVASGFCDEKSQNITLKWDLIEQNGTYENYLTFNFQLNKNKNASVSDIKISPQNYALANVAGLTYYVHNNTVENKTVALEGVNAYETKQNNSYRCMSEEILKSKDGSLHLKLVHLQMQAFHTTGDSTFGTVTPCTLDGYVADIVPIAVGASLAGLVAIVLVAYLIGRRRSRARGYQSV